MPPSSLSLLSTLLLPPPLLKPYHSPPLLSTLSSIAFHGRKLAAFPPQPRLSPAPPPPLLRRRPAAAAPDSPAIELHEIVERDWSFLDPDPAASDAEREEKLGRVLAAAGAGEGARVLVSLGGEDFVDRLVGGLVGCSMLLVVHYSLLVLALIKEQHDKVRCWQGELVQLPQKWAPLDVVFLPHLPALNSSLHQLLGALAGRCNPGARVVISDLHGRECVKRQKEEHPDVVTSDLPHRSDLEKVAAHHSLEICEFVDDPTFYLAVLKFS